jgi:hypothetical protein
MPPWPFVGNLQLGREYFQQHLPPPDLSLFHSYDIGNAGSDALWKWRQTSDGERQTDIWNEWTEGSYLRDGRRVGNGCLKAIQATFR